MSYVVISVCVGSGRGGRCWGDRVWALPILEEHGESGIYVCFGCGGVGGVGGEWMGGLGQGLGGWDDVMYVCVVSLDYLC